MRESVVEYRPCECMGEMVSQSVELRYRQTLLIMINAGRQN